MFHGLWHLAKRFLLTWVAMLVVAVHSVFTPASCDEVSTDRVNKLNGRFNRKRNHIAWIAWCKSWLKTTFFCLEGVVYRMDTLEYRQRRYRRGYGLPRFNSKGLPTLLLPILWYLRHRKANKVNLCREICLLYYAYNAEKAGHVETDKGPPTKPRIVKIDSDSHAVGVDNRATKSISDNINDFEGPVRPINRRIKGFGKNNIIGNVFMGTIVWHIEDDQGRMHTIRLPNSLYVPEGGVRLLSPQQWAQVAKDHKPLPRGTRCVTYDDEVILEWGQRKFRRTLKLDQHGSNVATIYTAPGFTKYAAYEAKLDPNHVYVMESNVVSDDEESQDGDEDPSQAWTPEQVATPESTSPTPVQETFNLGGPSDAEVPEVIPDEEDKFPSGELAGEFLHYHHRFGHCSPAKVKSMASQGLIPK